MSLEQKSLYEEIQKLSSLAWNEFGSGEQYYAITEALSIARELTKKSHADYGYVSEKIRHVEAYFQ